MQKNCKNCHSTGQTNEYQELLLEDICRVSIVQNLEWKVGEFVAFIFTHGSVEILSHAVVIGGDDD